jgi:hypothetical protein
VQGQADAGSLPYATARPRPKAAARAAT